MTDKPDYARYGRRRLMKGAGLAGLAGLAGCIGTGDPGAGGDGSDGGNGNDGNGSDGSDGSDGDDSDAGGNMASEVNVWGWDVAVRFYRSFRVPYDGISHLGCFRRRSG